MDKITFKLIRYFTSVITAVVFLCLLVSSIFLSRFYTNLQYRYLKDEANEIYTYIKSGDGQLRISSNAIIIKDNLIYTFGRNRAAMLSLIRGIDVDNFPDKGMFTIADQNYLYYKYPTEWGYVIVLRTNKYSSDYMNVLYLFLGVVFLVSIISSLPFISHLGKKFTKPIMKLKSASMEISAGNFEADTTVNTGDEIEELADSLRNMSDNLKKKYLLQKEFIANVSHDFKTPLSIIRNYSEAIRDGILDADGVQKSGSTIMEEADKLSLLVNELMELSKLQSGSYKIQKEEINLKDFIDGICGKLSAIASQKGITLNYSSIDTFIMADYTKLSRVLYNFVDNAVKFTPLNGTITIDCTSDENGIKVSVKDTGMGIDESIINEIWDRYYKIDSSGGMGLGLAICSEILKLHKYEYGATSRINEGSTFYFIVGRDDIL
jgi:signal transduction histidine kinase